MEQILLTSDQGAQIEALGVEFLEKLTAVTGVQMPGKPEARATFLCSVGTQALVKAAIAGDPVLLSQPALSGVGDGVGVLLATVEETDIRAMLMFNVGQAIQAAAHYRSRIHETQGNA